VVIADAFSLFAGARARVIFREQNKARRKPARELFAFMPGEGGHCDPFSFRDHSNTNAARMQTEKRLPDRQLVCG
jgi:hypothetical protein